MSRLRGWWKRQQVHLPWTEECARDRAEVDRSLVVNGFYGRDPDDPGEVERWRDS